MQLILLLLLIGLVPRFVGGGDGVIGDVSAAAAGCSVPDMVTQKTESRLNFYSKKRLLIPLLFSLTPSFCYRTVYCFGSELEYIVKKNR